MRRIRVIPVLLLKNGGLVKTVRFKDPKYIGDPINAVKIFNEKEVDELTILDISATPEKRGPNFKQIKEIASEAFMPIGYGGGITTTDEIKQLIQNGVEKVVLNTSAILNLSLISESAKLFGNQSIVVAIDVKKSFWGNHHIRYDSGRQKARIDLLSYVKTLEGAGAGEIIINSIDQDGTFKGYDIEVIQNVCNQVKIPVIASGGAGKIDDFHTAVKIGGASAVAAGSFFVFQSQNRAVLINYQRPSSL